jgi:RimJ/RimL family protein N-acetyltransferase
MSKLEPHDERPRDTLRRADPGGLIHSERLVLEPLQGSHAPALFALLEEPRLYRWISVLPPLSCDALRRRWQALGVRSMRSEGLSLGWAVRRTSDGRYLGKCDAEVDPDDVASNVGYILGLPFWGQGYATELVRALASHLEQHGIIEQRALVTLGNEASERVLSKAGFIRGRVIVDNDTIRGQKHDEVEYLRKVCSSSE